MEQMTTTMMMMTKSCSPAMIVVTILFENRIPVAHSVVLNSSMMRMSLRSPHLVVVPLRGEVRADLQGVPVEAQAVHLVVHLVVLEVVHLVEVLAVAPQVEAPVVVPPAEVPVVVLLVEAPKVALPVEVKVAHPSERAPLGD